MAARCCGDERRSALGSYAPSARLYVLENVIYVYCHLLSLCIYMPVVYDERVRAEAMFETQTNRIVVAFRVL